MKKRTGVWMVTGLVLLLPTSRPAMASGATTPKDQPIVAASEIDALEISRSRGTKESPFAASTEGSKRCPNCGLGNMSSDATCASCGADLPG